MLPARAAKLLPAESQKYTTVVSVPAVVPNVLPATLGITIVAENRVGVVVNGNDCEPMPVIEGDGEPPVPKPWDNSTPMRVAVPADTQAQNDSVTVLPDRRRTSSVFCSRSI